ncbi:hypothetical protein D3C74_307500 [compost metagenome]
MPDLGRHTPATAHELAVDDDRAAQPRADREHEHVRGVASRAELELGPARGVGVVLDDDLHVVVADQRADLVSQRVLAPRDVGGEEDRRAVGAHEAGCGQAHGLDLELLGQLGVHVRDRCVDARDVVGLGVATRLRKDLAVLVDHTRGDLRSADVDSDGMHVRSSLT